MNRDDVAAFEISSEPKVRSTQLDYRLASIVPLVIDRSRHVGFGSCRWRR